MSGLAAALAAKKENLQQATQVERPVTQQSALLAQIQEGTKLRKVEPQKEEPKTQAGAAGMSFNVAMILERRAAMEYSDSDEDISGEEEWDEDDDDW